MTNSPEGTSADPAVDVVPQVEVVEGGAPQAEQQNRESVEQPAKVMRVGSMIKQLLDEVRAAPLDDAGRARLKDIYETAITELAEALSPDLREELAKLAMPFDEAIPSDPELRIAQASLVGWLEGLFHGIQATMYAQQMQARQQMEDVARQQRGLPVGPQQQAPGTGTYL